MTSGVVRTGRSLARGVVARLPYEPPEDGPVRLLFNSFSGHYSDSPRSIYEEMARRDPGLHQSWIASPSAAGEIPASVRTFPVSSVSLLREAGHAHHLISNVPMPRVLRKRRGQTYVQTWHGTPLKRIGLDNPRWGDNPRGTRDLEADVRRWDVLLSQNRFSTEIFRTAFGFDGEILESGYPRNDVLFAPDRDQVRAQARARLGIEDGQTAVLYAPTWRDNLLDPAGRPAFEMELDAAQVESELGDGVQLLLRVHHFVPGRLPESAGKSLIDVSAEPDISALYLAADVLLTDYSSAMFDFAITGKPMVFFTYDLAAYRDHVRGFYFDFETEAPGPLCATSGEVIEALREIDDLAGQYRAAYGRFHERYCALEDGQASRRVADRILGST